MAHPSFVAVNSLRPPLGLLPHVRDSIPALAPPESAESQAPISRHDPGLTQFTPTAAAVLPMAYAFPTTVIPGDASAMPMPTELSQRRHPSHDESALNAVDLEWGSPLLGDEGSSATTPTSPVAPVAPPLARRSSSSSTQALPPPQTVQTHHLPYAGATPASATSVPNVSAAMPLSCEPCIPSAPTPLAQPLPPGGSPPLNHSLGPQPLAPHHTASAASPTAGTGSAVSLDASGRHSSASQPALAEQRTLNPSPQSSGCDSDSALRCLAAMISVDAASCDPAFSRDARNGPRADGSAGGSHKSARFEHKFCNHCRAGGILVRASRVRLLAPRHEASFQATASRASASRERSAFWQQPAADDPYLGSPTATMDGGTCGFRTFNDKARCTGPKILVFEREISEKIDGDVFLPVDSPSEACPDGEPW